jgi:hypothetical protein
MGGEICFAVRRSNGTEFSMLCWTNILPWRMFNKDFYDEGSVLDRLVATAKRGNTWPEAMPIGTINSSEYGIVLVDFVTREIFSRQMYFNPAQRTIFSHDDQEDFESAKELIDAGMAVLTREDKRLECKTYELSAKAFKVDHKTVRGEDAWDEVKAWLSANNWKTKPSTRSYIKSYYKRDMGGKA